MSSSVPSEVAPHSNTMIDANSPPYLIWAVIVLLVLLLVFSVSICVLLCLIRRDRQRLDEDLRVGNRPRAPDDNGDVRMHDIDVLPTDSVEEQAGPSDESPKVDPEAEAASSSKPIDEPIGEPSTSSALGDSQVHPENTNATQIGANTLANIDQQLAANPAKLTEHSATTEAVKPEDKSTWKTVESRIPKPFLKKSPELSKPANTAAVSPDDSRIPITKADAGPFGTFIIRRRSPTSPEDGKNISTVHFIQDGLKA